MGTTTILGFLATALATYFAMCNPLANTPIFISMTAGQDGLTKRAVATRAVLTAFLIVTAMSLFGKLIGDLFGITLPAFRVAGGVIVSLIGYHMLHGSPSKIQHGSTVDTEEPRPDREAALSAGTSPLGIPIMAGAGTIAAAVNFSAQDGLEGTIISIVAFAVIMAVTYAMFLAGDRVERALGENGIEVVTRLMGLILATIGVQLLFAGLSGFITTFSASFPWT